MLTLNKPPSRDVTRWSRPGSRIGLDIGSSAIKWAEVVPENGGWRLAAAHLLPYTTSLPLDHDAVRRGEIRASLRGAMFRRSLRRQNAACTLSMALTDLRSLDLPAGSPDELRQMAYNELSDGLGESQLEFTMWETLRNDGESNTTSVTALALPTSTAMAVASDLHAERVRCRLLTAMPYALAQAVTMVDPTSAQQPVGVLDWGCLSPSLTIVQRGRPVFTRQLRDCGAGLVTQAVSQWLHLSTEESWNLLASLGARRGGAAEGSPLTSRVEEAARSAMKPLLHQLERTQAFMRQQYRHLVPERLWMVGVGALLDPLFPAISAAFSAEVKPWRLPVLRSEKLVADDPMQAVLAAAIGLAAIGDFA